MVVSLYECVVDEERLCDCKQIFQFITVNYSTVTVFPTFSAHLIGL